MGHKASSIVSQKVVQSNPRTSNRLSEEYYAHQLLKRHRHVDFDVEAWYAILQSETFPTRFISITPSLARAFVNHYQTRYNSKNLLTQADLEQIQRIETELQQQVIGNVFIRLSSRSPKDGNPLDTNQLMQMYHHELNQLQEHYSTEMNSDEGKANMQCIAFSSAQSQCLKVTTAQEALSLILSSERVFVDLLEALDCHEAQETIDQPVEYHEWNHHIIIRQWNDRLDHSMEFRCFIYQSKLTAISQYNHYCKFYHFQDRRLIETVKLTIMNYWQKTVQHLLKDKYTNYIIDLGLIRNDEADALQCLVIEMNPFESTTGASLFDWKIDHDQLMGYTNHVEIRVRADYFPHIQQYADFVLRENHIINE